MSSAAPVAPPGVFPPPPDVTADFENPPQHTNGLVPLIVVFLSLATIFLALRLYTKGYLLRLLGWEDVAITVAWMCDVAFMSFYIRGLQLGAGSHIWNFKMVNYPEYGKLAAATNLLYTPATGLPKIAILLFYLRINPSQGFRIGTFIVIGFTWAYIIGILLVQLFACHPVEKLWKPLTPGWCINERPIFLTIPIAGTVLDLFTLCLPIPMLIQLRVNIRTKLALMAVFSVCSCTAIISALRIWSVSKLLDTPDLTWNAAISNCLTVAEINLMIVCGSVLVLRPFCRRHLPFLLGGDNQRPSDEMLGFGGRFLVNRQNVGAPNYDGPMGPLSKSHYRAKIHGGLGGRKGHKRSLWGIAFAPSTFTGTDTEDEDLESLSAELKRLPAVALKRNTYDKVGATKLATQSSAATLTNDRTMNYDSTNSVQTNAGGGQVESRPESNGRPATAEVDLGNGIVKTVSLDVR